MKQQPKKQKIGNNTPSHSNKDKDEDEMSSSENAFLKITKEAGLKKRESNYFGTTVRILLF